MVRTAAKTIFVLVAGASLGQRPAKAPKAIPMPQDRVADSYAIYSQLLPDNSTTMIQEATVSTVPADKPCRPEPNSRDFDFYQNPHTAIRSPKDRQSDLDELLADFDQHCHESVLPTHAGFQSTPSYRLLTHAESEQFQSDAIDSNSRKLLARDYPNASGLLSFSEVYFNGRHTMAMVHSSLWCGMLCGTWKWIVFEQTDGKWHELNWPISVTVS